MDFSPYRKQAVQKSGYMTKLLPYIYLLLAAAIGFFIFWIIKSYFLKDDGFTAPSFFQKNESVAEVQVKDLGIWTNLLEGAPVMDGDVIRIKKGNDGVIILVDGSRLYLGENSQVFIESIKKGDDDSLFGDIYIKKDPIIFSGNSAFNEEKELKIWVNDTVYIDAGINSFLVENDIISVVSGESIHIVKLNAKGKIQTQKNIGIGQSLNASTFSLLATPESAKNNILLSSFSGKKGKPTPKSEGLTESLTLTAPSISSPLFTGSAIEVKNGKQKIEGTADLLAEKIIIVFSNGETTEELSFSAELSDDKEEKEWSYTVSNKYDTLLEGLNTYKIYAVDKNNERSKASVLVLNYENIDEDTDESTNEDISSDDEETSSGSFAITSPNGGNNAVLKDNSLVLSGTAPSNASYITISIPQLGYSYTLSKFKKGDSSWKYWNSSLKEGDYKMIVYAKNANKKIIGTEKITITVPSTNSSDEETASPSSKTTPVATATKKPTPTPKPAVTVSTMEGERN